MLTHGSLFSGIGGFDFAAQKAGINNIFTCEIEPYPHEVLKQNLKHQIHFRDIRDVKELPVVDIISAGFPCQDISIAGHQKGITKETRSGLFHEIIRLISGAKEKAKYIILENVSQLRSNGLRVVLENLSTVGYHAEWAVIPAHAVGRKHNRQRLWLVAYTDSIRHARNFVFGPELQALLTKKKKNNVTKKIPTRLSEAQLHGTTKWWKSYGVGGDYAVDDGVWRAMDPDVREAAKALGNSIVVDIAECIFKRLIDISLGSDR